MIKFRGSLCSINHVVQLTEESEIIFCFHNLKYSFKSVRNSLLECCFCRCLIFRHGRESGLHRVVWCKAFSCRIGYLYFVDLGSDTLVTSFEVSKSFAFIKFLIKLLLTSESCQFDMMCVWQNLESFNKIQYITSKALKTIHTLTMTVVQHASVKRRDMYLESLYGYSNHFLSISEWITYETSGVSNCV